jgi:hypothetical protein
MWLEIAHSVWVWCYITCLLTCVSERTSIRKVNVQKCCHTLRDVLFVQYGGSCRGKRLIFVSFILFRICLIFFGHLLLNIVTIEPAKAPCGAVNSCSVTNQGTGKISCCRSESSCLPWIMRRISFVLLLLISFMSKEYWNEGHVKGLIVHVCGNRDFYERDATKCIVIQYISGIWQMVIC